MQSFNLNKLWITTKELLKITSISRANLFRYMKEWKDGGNDLKDMGRISLKGSASYLWDPRVFIGWLIKHKLQEPIKFDYELKEKETIKNILVVNNLPLNRQQLWKEENRHD